MNRIRAAIVALSALFLIIFLDIFFSALIPPFNAIEIIPIAIVLTYLTFSLEHAFIAALATGVFQDYAALRSVGLQTIFYLAALAVLQGARRTVITHENKMTVIISGIIFFTIVTILQALRAMEINFQEILETLFRIIVNSALLALGYLIIKKIQREINKRFL